VPFGRPAHQPPRGIFRVLPKAGFAPRVLAPKAVFLGLVAVLCAAGPALAVPGDTNCDTLINAADFDALIVEIFADTGFCPDADVNEDGMVSGADIPVLIELLPALPTPRPTSTPTPDGPTPTVTPGTPPTATETLTPSATYTASNTATASDTPTITNTPTITQTPSQTLTPSRTETPTRTGTFTRTRTWTRTFTRTRTLTRTRTPTNTRRPTRTGTPTRTRTNTRTATRTRTETQTKTPTNTRTASWTATETETRPPTSTPTETRTPSQTWTPSNTRTPTLTLTPSSTRTPSPTSSFTRTRTDTRTPTETLTPTITRTPTLTRTPSSTRTPSFTLTPTLTRTPSLTPSPTPTQPPGPEVLELLLATADNHPRDPIGFTNDNIPIYEFPNGFGFVIVVEGRAGTNSGPPGICGTVTSEGGVQPCNGPRSDLEIQANRTLGNGNPAICDIGIPGMPGGVPAINPPSFANTPMIDDAINDLACHFDSHSSTTDACTLNDLENFRFVNPLTAVQFCSAPVIGSDANFPVGDTLLTVRLRSGPVVGEPRSIIVRVSPAQP